jgi:hypothetical protein|tara:strand:+ start:2508 stop:2816 length:309 start_codon:yes stop_codon:yes gene_type:complete
MDDLALLIEQAETAEKPGAIGYALIHFCGLPDVSQTYSWFTLMCKRYDIEHARALVINVLENGTTIADFDADPRHFRSWFTATLKAKSQQGTAGAEGFRVFA